MFAATVSCVPPTLTETAFGRLAARIHGDIIRASDPRYEEARRVFNGLIDRRPGVIVRPANVADVIATVDYARETGLPFSVRGGGHNVAGFGTNHGGIVLDLASMRAVQVDPRARVATVQGGATWADVDHATHVFGLATPGGILSSTGVGGVTLGGGFGHLTRKHGLSCDNLLSAEVITADGRLVIANPLENPELFWAIRGGGGNFGVVTSFELRLHRVSTVLGGPIFYPMDRAADLMRFYREFIAESPEDLGAIFGFHILPAAHFIPEHLHYAPVCAVIACWSGPLDEGERILNPLHSVVPPILDLTGPMPYPVLNGLFDTLLPRGLHHYWKADFDRDLTDDAIAVHLDHGSRLPNSHSFMHLYPLTGAVHRVCRDATAFSHRDASFAHLIAGIDPDPAAMPARTAWVRDYWSALHPHSAGGAYVNFLMDEGQDRIRATYRDNFPGLTMVKRTWDPTNLFRMNQNIRPNL